MAQPRLWKKYMSFIEWKLQYPHLNDREATQLYLAEQRLFENYQHDLINQQLLIQNNIIAENIYTLADNISNIFNTNLYNGRGNNFALPGGEAFTPDLELITDNGDLLITDEGQFLVT